MASSRGEYASGHRIESTTMALQTPTTTLRSCWSRLTALAIGLLLAGVSVAGADDEKFNYDEARVPAYTLPDPLKMQDGRPVTTASAWRDERRGELLRLFETQVYGQRPPTSQILRAQILETAAAVHGKATRKRIQLSFSDPSETFPGFTITLLVPRGAKGPAPAFIGMHLFDSLAFTTGSSPPITCLVDFTVNPGVAGAW
jgi:hypothetical protein